MNRNTAEKLICQRANLDLIWVESWTLNCAKEHAGRCNAGRQCVGERLSQIQNHPVIVDGQGGVLEKNSRGWRYLDRDRLIELLEHL